MKIAIAGKMASGKSTAAQYLKELNPEFETFSFASKVKQIATDLFGMTSKDRTLLTSIGKKMREIDSDVWANYTLKETHSRKYAVIDDLRHFNEYRILKEHGWKIIKLNISPELQLERLSQISTPKQLKDHLNNMNDVSEQEIVNSSNEYFDLVINVNNDSVQEKIKFFYQENYT
jgi:dephospho-CoA kinase